MQIPSDPVQYVTIGLVLTALALFLLPFLNKVQRHLEVFLLFIGVVSITLSQAWERDLVIGALNSPLMVGNVPVGPFQIVLIFGILTYVFRKPLQASVIRLAGKLGPEVFAFTLITLLGILSGVVSLVVTSVILGEILTVVSCSESSKVRLAVIGCFAIGLGSCLTPLGGPQCTILVAKLTGPPYQADFLFPLRVFGVYLIPGIIALGMLGAAYAHRNASVESKDPEYRDSETLRDIVLRPVRLYVRIVALVMIGFGFEPLIIRYIAKIPPWGLYWVNLSSAVLDNAALTALEIHPSMSLSQIIGATIAIIFAGSMLILGNMANIVVSSRLKISMKEWAIIGVPLSFIAMVLYFVVLVLSYPQSF